MDNTADLIVSDHPIGMNLETCIAGWIQEKRDLSESEDTELAYSTTLFQFRALLQSAQRDLDADPREVAPAAQGWAGHSTQPGKSVAAGTYNQRLAILSSFYKYAIRHEVLHYNPIERVMRRKQGRKDAARPIPTPRVKEGFAQIDQTLAEGKRDYTLLVIAWQRAAALMNWQDFATVILPGMARRVRSPGSTVKATSNWSIFFLRVPRLSCATISMLPMVQR